MLDYSVSVSPLGEIEGFPVRPGLFDVFGAMPLPSGVNFTIHTHGGTSCELLLFRKGAEEPYAVLPFPEEYKIGDVYSMMVFGLEVEEFEYAYRIDGPYDPEKGLLFDKKNILLDPYARAVTGQGTWGSQSQEHYHARVVKDVFDWGTMPQSKKELNELVIYELHVRGFTKHPSSGVRQKGTFAGLKEKIPYLKELGINAVELMPIFEFDETMNAREVNGKTLLDYWGYNTVGFFAPNSSYTAAEEYNHEGTELDNNEYYMLTPDGNSYNFSGCGNTLNCNNPIVRQMIADCLRYWTISYRVDGFRFDLASILGRSEDGSPMNNPPLLQTLTYDPILSNVKLIAEAWDAGGMYQVGSFPAGKRWAEWNGRYRDAIRGYLKGDCWLAWEAAWSVAGSSDLYGEGNSHGNYAGYNSCVNFITCHDGFTLYDLYSYNQKHNENNGWDNTDGANDNRSWNCGAEGETQDPEVLKLRFRMIRNACAVLMCSRGTPMFLAGDEFGNTQFGNNNGYCQDNELSWLDWTYLEKNRDLFEFFKFMIAYRFRHPVIRKELPRAVCGMDALHAHDVNADRVNIPRDTRVFATSFAGYDKEKGQDDVVYLAINTYWEDVEITLPKTNRAGYWYLSVNTYGDENGRYFYEEHEERRIEGSFVMKPRTVAVFHVRKY